MPPTYVRALNRIYVSIRSRTQTWNAHLVIPRPVARARVAPAKGIVNPDGPRLESGSNAPKSACSLASALL